MAAKTPLWESENLKVVLFITGIASLLVVASITAIFYARGERPTLNGVERTGALKIDSEPQDVAAFLDNNEITITENLISNIEPGEYTLRLVREGYLPWEKQVQISANLVEEVSVNLIPTDLQLEQVSPVAVDSINFAPTGEFLFYASPDASRGEDVGIWRERIATGGPLSLFSSDQIKITNLTPLIEPALSAGDYALIPSPDSNRVLLRIPQTELELSSSERKLLVESEFVHFVLDAGNYNEPQLETSLEARLGFAFTRVSWITGERLAIADGNLLTELDLTNDQTRLISYSPSIAPIYAVGGGQVYFVEPASGTISRFLAGTVVDLELENVELVSGVTEIHTGRQATDSIFYRANGNYYFLDIGESYQAEIPELNTIARVNSSGNQLLGTTSSGTSVVTITELPAVRDFRIVTDQIELPESESSPIASIKFSLTGANLLATTEAGSLYIGSNEGANWAEAFTPTTSLSIRPGNFDINTDNSQLYLLLLDSSDNAQDNIYSVPLRL